MMRRMTLESWLYTNVYFPIDITKKTNNFVATTHWYSPANDAMAAAARSEARRRAILARGNDRLAKLTASARGEDATTYVHDGDL